ncbi:ARM repeat superfamily protein isoform X1 [Wolffia australiana]
MTHLAAVLVKQYIKQHWQEDDESFVHPVVSSGEKESIRELLLFSLDDHHGKLRTAVAMAVASIAHYDWPEDWPDLIPHLLRLLSDQSTISGVGGALRALALLSDDLDDSMVPKLAPVLFPHLLKIVSSPNLYGKPQRSKALSIFHSCISILASMSGVFWTETRAFMMPILKSWMEQFAIVLQTPVDAKDPDDWSIRMEVLKCLTQFVQNFPDLMEKEFSVFYYPLWGTFISCFKVYESSLIEGAEDPYVGLYDSDGKEKSLESFVIQLFEFLITVVGSRRLAKIMGRNVKELVFYSIPFLQMTEEQVQSWSADPNHYLADESDVSYSCRTSGSLLLEEVINSFGLDGINSILEAVHKHYDDSIRSKNAGLSNWWRMREALILSLCTISDQLLEAQDSRSIDFSLADFLHNIFIEGIGTEVHQFPFLRGRIFSAIAKFSSLINQDIRQQFLLSAIQAISTDVSCSPTKVGACQALSQLLTECNPCFLQTQIFSLFSSLTDLLNKASEETLHLVLETLKAAVKAGGEHSASIEAIISPIILNTWLQHVSDPFISIDALEVLEEIKNAPGCMEPLVSRILPSIKSILENPQIQSSGLVGGTLDLLTMLLKDSPPYLAKALFDSCFNSVVNILLLSDDYGEMQNATQCLAGFVSAGKQELLAWSSDPAITMKSLFAAASRLLDPDLESSGSLFISSYVLQLIVHFPSEMAVHIRDLMVAIVHRMESCEIAGLRSSLIVIVARLVHLCTPHVEQFINLLLTIPAKGHENSLVYIMSEWAKQQPEIQGSYQIKITTTALVLLLSTRHPELAKVYVQGNIIKSGEGIVTRSRGKKAPERWTIVSLPSKIFSHLADSLIEIQEQELEKEEDSEWEEDEGEGGLDQDVLLSSMEQSGSRPSVEQLSAMARVLDDDDDDDDFEDLIKRADPLNQIDLSGYLKEFLLNLSNQEGSLFESLYRDLAEGQKEAINRILRRF